jgi:hypothetical protein
LINGVNDGEYAIPAVGTISINLSDSDVAGFVAVTLLRGNAFFTGAFGLLEIFGAAVAFGVTVAFTDGFALGFLVFFGAGATVFLTFGPLPFRPSMTIFPSCV